MNNAGNKKFWKTFKPFLSDKIKSQEKVTLVENNSKIITQDIKIAEKLNSYFFQTLWKICKFPNLEK